MCLESEGRIQESRPRQKAARSPDHDLRSCVAAALLPPGLVLSAALSISLLIARSRCVAVLAAAAHPRRGRGVVGSLVSSLLLVVTEQESPAPPRPRSSLADKTVPNNHTPAVSPFHPAGITCASHLLCASPPRTASAPSFFADAAPSRPCLCQLIARFPPRLRPRPLGAVSREGADCGSRARLPGACFSGVRRRATTAGLLPDLVRISDLNGISLLDEVMNDKPAPRIICVSRCIFGGWNARSVVEFVVFRSDSLTPPQCDFYRKQHHVLTVAAILPSTTTRLQFYDLQLAKRSRTGNSASRTYSLRIDNPCHTNRRFVLKRFGMDVVVWQHSN